MMPHALFGTTAPTRMLGLHMVDMEVAMGNLIDLVGQQTKSYLGSTRRR